MKTFTKQEIRDLYNRFFREEISFSRMVEIMNERVSERVEEIPVRKFKKGDKVRIKEGISSKTHYWEFPGFTKEKDAYIGKVLTVYGYDRFWQVEVDECEYTFSENWLELVSDEPEIGDWVIAWSPIGNEMIVISQLMKILNMEGYFHKYLVGNVWFKHAVKWDGTKEQLEKLRKS